MQSLSDNLIIGFMCLMMVLGLMYYYRKIGHVHLRTGAFAYLFCGLAALAVPILEHLTLSGADGVGILGRFLFAAGLFTCFRQVAGLGGSLNLLVAGMVALGVASILVTLFNPGEVVGRLALELPALALSSLGLWALTRHRHTASALSTGVMMAFYLGLSTGIHVLELEFLQPFDAIAMLLLGGSLIVMSMEAMIDELTEHEKRLDAVAMENRRLELQFEESQRLESLGVLASGIAHDFNNMLTSIIGYTSLAIRRLPVDSEVRKDLYMAMSGARQASELSSEMLTYAGKGPVSLQSLELSALVDGMSGLVNSLVPRHIHLVHNTSRDLPLVRGDSSQLGQILMNLVANAIDAITGPGGEIMISTGIRQLNAEQMVHFHFAADREPGVYVYLAVADSGVGIPDEMLEKIFDPFYSGKSRGRGLGLASLSGIVRQHNGMIGVQSKAGSGSTFTVYLPAVAYRDQGASTRDGARRDGREPASRTLLADDDPRIRGLIKSILLQENHNVIEAENGREALDLMAGDTEGFDLFVLDCTMPKQSGDEVYRAIRSRGFVTTPVVMISGFNQEQVLADLDRDPNVVFLKKPFSVDELLETLDKLRSPISRPA